MKNWLPEELEEICCDFCGTKEVSCEYTRADRMRVVECAVCGLAYLNPRPRCDLIPSLYQDDYFTGVKADRGEGGLRLNLELAEVHPGGNQNHYRPLEIIKENFGGLLNKNLLEIGCATGNLLFEAKRAGARAEGLEISDCAADVARKRGLDVKTGMIENYVSGRDEIFDIVMAFEVIEHVLSPSRFLRQVSQLLRPEGLLLLSTPNYACANRFGQDWYGFNYSFEHLYFFSLEVVKRIAQKYNLKLKYWETTLDIGGPRKPLGFIERQTSRLYTAALLFKEMGIPKTTRIILTKSPRFQPYGSGHTLLAVFEKSLSSNLIKNII